VSRDTARGFVIREPGKRSSTSRVRREIRIADEGRGMRIPRSLRLRGDSSSFRADDSYAFMDYGDRDRRRGRGRTASRFSVIFSDLRVGSSAGEKQDAA